MKMNTTKLARFFDWIGCLRSSMSLFLAFVCIAVFSSNCPAELSQSYYATLQYIAPESLSIRIKRTIVTRTLHGDETMCEVRAEAVVEAISRTGSQLRIGQCIVIEYSTVERRVPITGPSPIPVLQVGESYPAFLNSTQRKCAYHPIARGYSFCKVDAEPDATAIQNVPRDK